MPYIFFLLAIAALAPIYSAENVSLPCLLLNDTTARPCGPNCWELITRTSWTRDSRINNREKVYEEYTDSTLIGPLFVEKGIKPAIVCAAVKQPGKKVLAGLDTATINFVGPGWCKNEKDVWQSEAIFQNDQPTPSVTLLDPELIKTYYVWSYDMLAAGIALLIFSVFFGLPWRKKIISRISQVLASAAFVWTLILNVCFFSALFAPPRPGPLTSWLLFISMAVSIIFLIAALFGSKIFVVEDRMNKRWENNRFDIWFASTKVATNFGLQTALIEVVE